MSLPTLQTIADKAGVSRMTVSRVLRYDRAISEATSTRVRAIADELGYRPNPLITAHMAQLRATRPSQERPYIAFLTAQALGAGWRKTFLGDVFEGAEKRATECGYGLNTVWMSEPDMTQQRLNQILLAQGVHGLIIGTLEPLSHLKLDWDRYAVAALGYTLVQPVFHRVASNHAQTLPLVLRQLKDRGYERIGLAIRRKTDLQTNHAILGSYQAWQFLQPPESRVEPCYLEDESMDPFGHWLKSSKLDALLITHPLMHQWLCKQKIRIPEELGVVQIFSDNELPGVAHIRRDYFSIGSEAVDLVINQLHRNERGIPAVPKVVSVDTIWEEGFSIKPEIRHEKVGAKRKRTSVKKG